MILNYNEFLLEKKRDAHDLSGIALILNGESILLVKPKKFKGQKHKWCLPKGKDDAGYTSIQNALRELYEETGIKLPENRTQDCQVVTVSYQKSKVIKSLDIYVVHINNDDIKGLNIDIDEEGRINQNFIKDNDEIHKCKFFSLKRAQQKVEYFLFPLFNKIKQKSIDIKTTTNIVNKEPKKILSFLKRFTT